MQNKELTFEQSLQVIMDGVNIAQRRGTYSFEESTIIGKALQVIAQKFKVKKEEKVETI